MKQALTHDIRPFAKEGGVSQWFATHPFLRSSSHNAKERNKWHSRCRQQPIAFATYCMICRGLVQEPSPFSWVCDVYGSIWGMQILSLGRICPAPYPFATARSGVSLHTTFLDFWRKNF